MSNMNNRSNMNNDNFDMLIRIAAIRSVYKTAEEDMNKDYSHIVVSKRIDRRIYKMIRSHERRERYAKARVICTRVALAILILMSIGTLTIIGNSRLRNAVWDVIVDWSDDHVSISYGEGGNHSVIPVPETTASESNEESSDDTATDTTGEAETTDTAEAVAPVEILNYKKPTALPEGVEEDEALKTKAKYAIDYYIGDYLYLSYYQTVLYDTANNFDDTNLTLKNTSVNGNSAVLLISDGSTRNKLIWSDGLYEYIISGFLSEEELISIAESIN